MVPVFNRQENFKCFRYNDIPGDYLGSLASLDSGAKVDLRKVRIGVRVRARDSFQKQATPEPLGQILIFWNHSVKSLKPLGQIPKTTRSNTTSRVECASIDRVYY